MNRVIGRLLLPGLFIAPALGACMPAAIWCGSARPADAGRQEQLQSHQDNVLWQAGAFALETEDVGSGHFSLQPSLKLDNKARLLLKLDPHRAEVRWKLAW
ncbi:hypothetical protein [Vogesella sp. LIG4]|uniref:hypothetical protein n=1 Tax=Vogesella sp. LIG4 TaxID=1192162 RepID=UPI00081FCD4F|nr:hypothetical protein [Vogesella sp. LIG4]SCK07949.1 hypothetical protein PSELUDRAFT_0441 [Vogesella sp. LIG4]